MRPKSKAKPKRRKKPAPQRPRSAQEFRDVLARHHREAPKGFEGATLLLAFVDLPGDNAQRSQHWAVKRRWQEQVRKDFRQSLAMQPHPGVISDPEVLVQMYVAGKGDPRNMAGRAKFLIDRLQRYREVPYVRGGKWGVRRFGDLDLIEDDSILNDDNCKFEEIPTRLKDGVNERRVAIWVKSAT